MLVDRLVGLTAGAEEDSLSKAADGTHCRAELGVPLRQKIRQLDVRQDLGEQVRSVVREMKRADGWRYRVRVLLGEQLGAERQRPLQVLDRLLLPAYRLVAASDTLGRLHGLRSYEKLLHEGSEAVGDDRSYGRRLGTVSLLDKLALHGQNFERKVASGIAATGELGGLSLTETDDRRTHFLVSS